MVKLGSEQLDGDPELAWRSVKDDLSSQDWQIRKQAVHRLGKYQHPQDLLPFLLEAVRDQTDAVVRNSALEVLTTLGGKIVPSLLQQLDESKPETQRFLIDVIGSVGSPLAAPRLTTLLKHYDQNVRFAASEALGRIAAPTSADALLQHLASTAEGTERFITLQALTDTLRQGVPNDLTIRTLRPLCTDPLLTRAMLEVLRVIDNDEAYVFLWSWLEDFDDFRLQEAAKFIGGLHVSKIKRTIDKIGFPQVTFSPETIRSLARSTDPDVRNGATWFALWSNEIDIVLAAYKDSFCASEHLVELLTFVEVEKLQPIFLSSYRLDLSQKRIAIHVLGQSDNPGHGDIIRALVENDVILTPNAFTALCKLGDTEVLDWLPALLQTPDNIDAVVEGLKALLPEHRNAILEVLAPWSETVVAGDQWQVLLMLVEQLNLVSLRNRVERAWKRAEPKIRAAALSILAKFRLEFARHYLSMALVDEDVRVRLAAAEILTDIAGPSEERELRMLLSDREAWIRSLGLRALVRLCGPTAEQDLLQKLSDSGAIVQIEAVRALQYLRLFDNAKRVRRLLQPNADPDVLAECIRYLAAASNEPTNDDGQWINHPNWRVRLEAYRWLGNYEKHRESVNHAIAIEEDVDVRTSIGYSTA